MGKDKYIKNSGIEDEFYRIEYDQDGKRHVNRVKDRDKATHILTPIKNYNGLLKVLTMWSAKACQNYEVATEDENGYKVENSEYKVFKRGNDIKAWEITMATKYAYNKEDEGTGDKILPDVREAILTDLRACYNYIDLPTFQYEQNGEMRSYTVSPEKLINPAELLSPENENTIAKIFSDWYKKLPETISFEIFKTYPVGGKGRWYVKYWQVNKVAI